MAYLALFVALGGSSYAALTVTSRNVPKDALSGADIKNLTGRDVKNNSLTGADVKNIGTGDVADSSLLARDFAPGQLPNGEKGDPGEKGDVGAPGTARAYALVDAAGNLVAAKSKNVVGVTHPTTGRTCVELPASIDAASVEGVVSIDYTDITTPNTPIARIVSGRGLCTGNRLHVLTTDLVQDPTTKSMFEIAADRPFFLMVP